MHLNWTNAPTTPRRKNAPTYLRKLLNEIQVQCEGIRSQCVTFHFSVYIFRYTEYYNDSSPTYVQDCHDRAPKSPFSMTWLVAKEAKEERREGEGGAGGRKTGGREGGREGGRGQCTTTYNKVQHYSTHHTTPHTTHHTPHTPHHILRSKTLPPPTLSMDASSGKNPAKKATPRTT